MGSTTNDDNAGAVRACSAGVALEKCRKGGSLSVKHSQPGTASCGFHSAGLASSSRITVTVHPSAGVWQRT